MAVIAAEERPTVKIGKSIRMTASVDGAVEETVEAHRLPSRIIRAGREKNRDSFGALQRAYRLQNKAPIKAQEAANSKEHETYKPEKVTIKVYKGGKVIGTKTYFMPEQAKTKHRAPEQNNRDAGENNRPRKNPVTSNPFATTTVAQRVTKSGGGNDNNRSREKLMKSQNAVSLETSHLPKDLSIEPVYRTESRVMAVEVALPMRKQPDHIRLAHQSSQVFNLPRLETRLETIRYYRQIAERVYARAA